MLRDVNQVQSVLKTLAEAELAVAAYYTECASTWRDDADLWTHLVNEEKKHAAQIDKMAQILSQRPERFAAGRPLNVAAIETFIAGIKDNTAQLKRRKTPLLNALFIARDIEQSIIESRYPEILVSDDLEFNALVKEIATDTVRHKDVLAGKIATVQAAR